MLIVVICVIIWLICMRFVKNVFEENIFSGILMVIIFTCLLGIPVKRYFVDDRDITIIFKDKNDSTKSFRYDYRDLEEDELHDYYDESMWKKIAFKNYSVLIPRWWNNETQYNLLGKGFSYSLGKNETLTLFYGEYEATKIMAQNAEHNGEGWFLFEKSHVFDFIARKLSCSEMKYGVSNITINDENYTYYRGKSKYDNFELIICLDDDDFVFGIAYSYSDTQDRFDDVVDILRSLRYVGEK